MALPVLQKTWQGGTTGFVWCVLGAGTGYDRDNEVRMDNANHYTTASWRGVVDGTARSMYLGGRGWNNTGIQSQIRVPTDRKTVVGPCELYASAVGARGYYGTIPDIYWSPDNQFRQGMGDTAGGAVNWFCGGSLIVPWDSAEPLPRVR